MEVEKGVIHDEYDCFISHAFEDKDDFVRELAQELKRLGFKVWYDEFSLNVGNSLSNSIDKGIKNSLCGIVVLSLNFFNKKWTKEELNRLTSKKNNSDNDIILPVWHNISYKEVYSYSPMLADLYATKSEYGIKRVCTDIANAINDLKII